jgi:hypothetical protein
MNTENGELYELHNITIRDIFLKFPARFLPKFVDTTLILTWSFRNSKHINYIEGIEGLSPLDDSY